MPDMDDGMFIFFFLRFLHVFGKSYFHLHVQVRVGHNCQARMSEQ